MSGSVALTAGSFCGFSVTGQFSHGFRDPVLSDRYFRGPSGRGFITGNPDLVPETSRPVGRRLSLQRRPVPHGVLHVRLHDPQPDRALRRARLPDDFFFRNRGEARLKGLELEAQVDLPEGFAVALAAQIERGETVDDDAAARRHPAGVVESPAAEGVRARRSSRRAASFYANDANPGPTERARPGYGLLDLGAGYSFAEFFEVQAYVRNVLDKAYLITPDARATLAPGISASFTGFVRF